MSFHSCCEDASQQKPCFQALSGLVLPNTLTLDDPTLRVVSLPAIGAVDAGVAPHSKSVTGAIKPMPRWLGTLVPAKPGSATATILVPRPSIEAKELSELCDAR